MSCESMCYELAIACCESPTIRAGITAGTVLKALLKRPGSSKIYSLDTTVDGTGAIVLDKDLLPDGFFAYGYLELELRSGSPLFTTVQNFVFNAKSYSCVLLELIDIEEV